MTRPFVEARSLYLALPLHGRERGVEKLCQPVQAITLGANLEQLLLRSRAEVDVRRDLERKRPRPAVGLVDVGAGHLRELAKERRVRGRRRLDRPRRVDIIE